MPRNGHSALLTLPPAPHCSGLCLPCRKSRRKALTEEGRLGRERQLRDACQLHGLHLASSTWFGRKEECCSLHLGLVEREMLQLASWLRGQRNAAACILRASLKLQHETIIGDFQKEQKKFVQEQQTKRSEAAVPPWVDSNEEETIQQQILALSADRRNFLRDPPAGVHFSFHFDQMYPVAMVMLQEDEVLNRMRFDLVPKHVKEEVFWRNYFYRVSLIKQSAQLTALAAQQQAAGKEDSKGREEDTELKETVRPKTPPVSIKPQIKPQEEEEEISTSPGVSEFVSDAFDACSLNQEDLRKEMEQLVLDKKKEGTSAIEEEAADWEKELQQELQEYEVVTESEKRDENWDKEIEEMLQEEN